MTPTVPTDPISNSEFVVLALERYEAPLIRYATRIVGDVEQARDVVQDTFLKLCSERLGKVRDHLAQWLFTVCRNRAYDVRQKEGRMNPLNEVDLRTKPATGSDPVEMLERKEKVQQVLDLMETLPEKQREVLFLKFQCELSYKAIAAITTLSVGNVGFLIHTGVQTIRERIQASSPTPTLVRRLP